MDTKNQVAKARDFLGHHQGPDILVLANVWDVVSARLVEQAGFSAVATSSAAIANSRGYPDGQQISREEMLAEVKRITARVALPVTADLEAGYGTDLPDLEKTIHGLLETGAVGLNFEDGTEDPKHPLCDEAAHVEKIKWIRQIATSAGIPLVLNARTDVFLNEVGEPASRLQHAIRRANAYRRAGADCLFVPGVRDRDTIAALVKGINGPLNILAGPGAPPMRELATLGVARVSFGSWPMRACMGLFSRLTRELRERGTFATLGDSAIPYAEMNKLLRG
jgi:2-methylisocitrate lyase-like PEP mutase family enzyme